MGKRITMQERGKGSGTYRVRKNAYVYRIGYPSQELIGEGKVVKLLNSSAHTSPLAKILSPQGVFFIPAFKGMIQGQTIKFSTGTEKIEDGTITKISNLPIKTKIYNLESRPHDGGKFIRTGGNYAEVNRLIGKDVYILLPSKKEKKFDKNCRATVGICAGAGRLDKPMVKAGRMHHLKKSKGKLWPRTSACKLNPVNHPFGSGRGKVAKQRIAKRNAPPGARVGLIRPRRTGKRK